MTDEQREAIAKLASEVDRAASAEAYRMKKMFNRRDEALAFELKIARALGFRSTQAYLGSLIKKGRPVAKWISIDKVKLHELIDGLPSRKQSQGAFAKSVGVSVDSVGRWLKHGKMRSNDFEAVCRYLTTEYPAFEPHSLLKK